MEEAFFWSTEWSFLHFPILWSVPVEMELIVLKRGQTNTFGGLEEAFTTGIWKFLQIFFYKWQIWACLQKYSWTIGNVAVSTWTWRTHAKRNCARMNHIIRNYGAHKSYLLIFNCLWLFLEYVSPNLSSIFFFTN